MADHRISLRDLSTRCRISKSRLGNLLHRTPARRADLTLAEFHALISALDLSIFEAIIRAETLDRDAWRASRYASLIAMLSRMFRDLPGHMIAALDELDDVDGTEIRPEWSIAIERAVIKRIVQEINAIATRRAAFADFSFS